MTNYPYLRFFNGVENELNLKEIGSVLGVSESRACQINNQAMLRLKSRLVNYAPS